MLTIEAQLPLLAVYGDRGGRPEPWFSGALMVVFCKFWPLPEIPGERRPAEGGGWMNCPIGG